MTAPMKCPQLVSSEGGRGLTSVLSPRLQMAQQMCASSRPPSLSYSSAGMAAPSPSSHRRTMSRSASLLLSICTPGGLRCLTASLIHWEVLACEGVQEVAGVWFSKIPSTCSSARCISALGLSLSLLEPRQPSASYTSRMSNSRLEARIDRPFHV